jgi:hexokinase
MKELKSFITELGLYPSLAELKEFIEKFIDEMNKGLNDEKSSLKMIPSYLKVDKIENDEKCIVIDAGGTNLRCGVIEFKKKSGYQFVSYERTELPGLNKEYTKEEFFDYICNFIEKDINKSDKIGFCFSYPIQKFPNKDGKLIKWTKEIKAPEVVGSMIGENLIQHLQKMGYKDKKIILLNDTVASLFGGLANQNNRDYDNYIGLIVGTGCNVAYAEEQRNIAKVRKSEKNFDENAIQVINVESGNFDKLNLTKIDKMLNDETQNPYQQVLEKMVSGKYLAKLVYHLTNLVEEENIIKNMSDIRSILKDAETKDISEWMMSGRKCNNKFANDLYSLKPNSEQLEALSLIVISVINRASAFVSAKLASLIHKRGKGKLIQSPSAIVGEGAVIESLPYFKPLLHHYLSLLLDELGDYYYDIIHIDKANIVGSGISALVNC